MPGGVWENTYSPSQSCPTKTTHILRMPSVDQYSDGRMWAWVWQTVSGNLDGSVNWTLSGHWIPSSLGSKSFLEAQSYSKNILSWCRLYSNFPNKNVCILKSVENIKGIWLKSVYWEYNTHTFFSEILLKSEALPCGFLSLSLMVITLSQNFGLLCPRRHLTFSMLDCRSLFPLRYYELHFPILFPWPQEPTIQTNFT